MLTYLVKSIKDTFIIKYQKQWHKSIRFKYLLQIFGRLWPHAKSWLIGKDSCWEGLGARGEGDDRGWDFWMASLTRWTWVWVNSGSWWWTGRPSVLWFMGSQRVGHDWATELNWTEVLGRKKRVIMMGERDFRKDGHGRLYWEGNILTKIWMRKKQSIGRSEFKDKWKNICSLLR